METLTSTQTTESRRRDRNFTTGLNQNMAVLANLPFKRHREIEPTRSSDLVSQSVILV